MDKVIINISSYKRKESLIKTIESIYDQCDIINVALNDYDVIPKELIRFKINVVQTNNEKGDAYKFMWLQNSDGYYLTIDDDLIYPKNYVNYLINKINEYDKKCVVTLHGRIFKSYPINSYYKDTKKEVFHFNEKLNIDKEVTFGGTGVMGFHTSLFKINLEYFKLPNMADVWIGKYAKECGIKIICLKHEPNFIIQQDVGTSIWIEQTKNDVQQTKIVNEIFDKKNLSIIIPTFNNTEYIDECINSILKIIKNQNIEVLVGIDGCEKTLIHLKSKSFPEFIKFYFFKSNVGPYIIKNSLTKISNSDNLLFFDSDDTMINNTIEEVIEKLTIYDCVKLKYNDYKNNIIIGNTKFGEGVFAIKKSLLLDMNGFEPWRVAADTDFMIRLNKRGVKFYFTNEVCFKRRVHNESLTQRKDTGYGSDIRRNYSKISENKIGNGNPNIFNIVDFTLVDTNTITKLPKPKIKVLNNVLSNKVGSKNIENRLPKEISELITKDLINKTNQTKEKFHSDVNPIKTQIEQIRQNLIDFKKSQKLNRTNIGKQNGGKFSR